jgi:hypothetical protein
MHPILLYKMFNEWHEDAFIVSELFGSYIQSNSEIMEMFDFHFDWLMSDSEYIEEPKFVIVVKCLPFW